MEARLLIHAGKHGISLLGVIIMHDHNDLTEED